MLTNETNRNPNRRKAGIFSALRRLRPRPVRFSAFFSQPAPAPLPAPPSRKQEAARGRGPFSRLFRLEPHRRLRLIRNTLRLLVLWWLAFLVGYLAALLIFLTTGSRA